MPFCKIILVFVRGLIVSRAKLSLELLALRQQPVVLWRTVGRPPDSESRQVVLDCGLTNLEGLEERAKVRKHLPLFDMLNPWDKLSPLSVLRF